MPTEFSDYLFIPGFEPSPFEHGLDMFTLAMSITAIKVEVQFTYRQDTNTK